MEFFLFASNPSNHIVIISLYQRKTKMVLYSFSQLSLYQQCPKKYQFRYLDKIERDFETTPDLVLGTSVHSALEWLYQQVSIFLTPELSDVI